MDKETLQKFMLEELKMIQEIIKRMATNSFMIKGWVITLVVASLLFKGNGFQAVIAFFPLITFWFLDAYYLRQERLYRKLYTWVINNRLENDEFLFDMNTTRFNNNVNSAIKTMFSVTLGWFYCTITILIVLYIIYLYK